MDSKKIGEFLKSLRKAKGFTQEEVANTLYLSPKTISRWESGLGIPDINIITSVADLYDVTVDEILRGSRIQAKDENLSDATIKIKEKSTTKLVCNNILEKLNKYFIVALAIEGTFLLLELLIGLLVSEVASIIFMPFGLISSIVVMVIGNNEIKNKFLSDDEETLQKGLLEAKKQIRKKNVLFSDIIFGAIILSTILIIIFIAS